MGVTVNHWLGGFEPHTRSQTRKQNVSIQYQQRSYETSQWQTQAGTIECVSTNKDVRKC